MQRSIAFAKGVSVLDKFKTFSVILMIILLLSPGAMARDYIEVWPEGWSEVTPLFTTSIFADRFFVANDAAGTSFLSVDGLYFKELDLTYRTVRNHLVEEEIVLSSKAEIDNAYLGLDEEGNRYVVWLERSPEGNSLNHTIFGVPYIEHQRFPFLVTNHTIQDIAAVQVGKTTHVVWSERDVYFQIRYGQIENGELVVLETVTDTEELSVRPSVTVDGQGIPHIAWLETTISGLDIHHSRRLPSGWTKPRKVGEGSVQDLQQGGSIAMASFGEEVLMAWAAPPRNSTRLFVHLSQVNANGEISTPAALAAGSKAQFVTGTLEPQLVWQGAGTFGAQINHGQYAEGRLQDIANLTVGRKGAFRPEAFSSDDFLHVYWLQANPDRGYTVFEINNQFPKAISLWRKVGIDETAPAYHLLFLFLSTLMMAVVYTIMNIGVLLAGGLVYGLFQRHAAFRKQALFYQIALVATILVVVRHLPIPAGNPEFFGLIHYGLSFALAIMGTFLILRNVRQRGLFMNVSILLLWMVLFQFFALIPQMILR